MLNVSGLNKLKEVVKLDKKAILIYRKPTSNRKDIHN